MTDPYSTRPAFTLLVTLAVASISTTAFVLTADRLPRPIAHETSTHTGECVMFCTDTEKPTQPPKSGVCLMFCDEKPWRDGDPR